MSLTFASQPLKLGADSRLLQAGHHSAERRCDGGRLGPLRERRRVLEHGSLAVSRYSLAKPLASKLTPPRTILSAELCHVYSTTGGQFDWTWILAPARCRRGLTYFEGCGRSPIAQHPITSVLTLRPRLAGGWPSLAGSRSSRPAARSAPTLWSSACRLTRIKTGSALADHCCSLAAAA
jgi:hypothetical protein